MVRFLAGLIPAIALIILWMPDFKIAFSLVIFYLILKDMVVLLMSNYQINYYLHKDKLPKAEDEQIRDL
jgi:hypothetical protein